MEKVKYVKFSGKKRGLSEIYQTVHLEFAFATKEEEGVYKAAHQFVLCRDFLHDVIWSQLNKKPVLIYGFKFAANKDDRIDTDKTKLFIRKPDIANHLERVEKVLHIFEKRMRIKKTKIYATQCKTIFLVVGSKSWMSSTQMISLYTLLIRMASNEDARIQEFLEKPKTFGEMMHAWKYNSGKISRLCKDAA
ncbi:MAG: hypothetical protein DRO87_11630, partial [Candidatus Thorarchaeota archaeon]